MAIEKGGKVKRGYFTFFCNIKGEYFTFKKAIHYFILSIPKYKFTLDFDFQT